MKLWGRLPGKLVPTLCIALPGAIYLPQMAGAQIENRPFKTFDVYPTITHGPILLRPTESSVTIMWTTDILCQAAVAYGEMQLDHEVEPGRDGLVPVGTVHVVELSRLAPGHTYKYEVISTPVLKLNPYWPDKGKKLESPIYQFTTFDRTKPSISFSFITDTHEDVPRLNSLLRLVDLSTTDFLVHGGDSLNFIATENQMFAAWLDPVSRRLNQTKPFVYVRGNHDLRGPFARDLAQYMQSYSEPFYYATEDGPVYLLDMDTGEDKADNTNVYAGLNQMILYRAREYEWMKGVFAHDPDAATAPFRIVVMHQPDWGWLNGTNQDWTKLANVANVDLVIAGHLHRLEYIRPGTQGNDYPILVVGQDQIARVDASSQALHITVVDRSGSVLKSISFSRRVPN